MNRPRVTTGSTIYETLIEPNVRGLTGLCGELLRSMIEQNDSLYPQNPPVKLLYLDPSIFFAFITKWKCSYGYKIWYACLTLFNMISDGTYTAITSMYNFETKFRNLIPKKVKFKDHETNKEQFVEDVLTEFKRIGLYVLDTPFLMPAYSQTLNEEDGLELAAAEFFFDKLGYQKIGFVTYDADFLEINTPDNIEILTPETLIPSPRDLRLERCYRNCLRGQNRR